LTCFSTFFLNFNATSIAALGIRSSRKLWKSITGLVQASMEVEMLKKLNI